MILTFEHVVTIVATVILVIKGVEAFHNAKYPPPWVFAHCSCDSSDFHRYQYERFFVGILCSLVTIAFIIILFRR